VAPAHSDADRTVLLSAIGGKVEVGETFLGAALREYREETGTPPPVIAARSRPILLGSTGRRLGTPRAVRS
jgi:8-oxo-dGTP pyrophosphatase MutT (NUDIX family)